MRWLRGCACRGPIDGTDVWGYTGCEDDATKGGSDPARWCHAQVLVFDKSNESSWDTTSRRRFLACHELGHTLGLRHRSASGPCMNNIGTYPTALPGHEQDHLEIHYGPMLAP